MRVTPRTNMRGAKSTRGLLYTGLDVGPMGALSMMPRTASIRPSASVETKSTVLLRMTSLPFHITLCRLSHLHDREYLEEEDVGQRPQADQAQDNAVFHPSGSVRARFVRQEPAVGLGRHHDEVALEDGGHVHQDAGDDDER